MDILKKNFPEDYLIIPDASDPEYIIVSRRGDGKSFKISIARLITEIGITSSGGAPIYFQGNNLPSLNNLDQPLQKGDWTLLSSGETYINIGGGDPLEPIEGDWYAGVFNGTTWTLKDMGELPIVPVVNNLESESETDALSAKQGKLLNEKITEAEGDGETSKIINALTVSVLEGNVVPDFKRTKEFLLFRGTINKDLYLFAPLMVKNNKLVGVNINNTDTLQLDFNRNSRAIGHRADGFVYVAEKNEPVSVAVNDGYRLAVNEPERENIGAVYYHPREGAGAVAPYLNSYIMPYQESPLGYGSGLKAINFTEGGVADKIQWPSIVNESITDRRFIFSVFVKGTKGEAINIFLKRNSGGASTGRVGRTVNFTGDWQRVATPVLTGLSSQLGLAGGFGQSSSTNPASEFLFWGSQIEEVENTTDLATSPIYFPPLSQYQIDFNTNPVDGVVFSSEVHYPDDYILTNEQVRVLGGRSAKFHFQQDAGEWRRSELRCNLNTEKTGMWYSWSTYFPSSYIPSTGEELFFQWRDVEDSCDYPLRSPSASMRTIGNNIEFRRIWDNRRCMPNNVPQGNEYHKIIEAFERDVWHDFIVKIRWDYTGVNSILQIWHRVNSNGDYTLLLDLSGQPIGYNDELTPRHKFGVYRPDNFKYPNGDNREVTSRTLYHAEVKCYIIDDENVTIDDLKTGVYDKEKTKLIREASSIDTEGYNVIDPDGDMRYFWIE